MKLKLFIGFFLVLILSSCGGESVKLLPEKPNIVLIVVDDLGWKDLGFTENMYYETPNLDALTKESIVFNRGYAAVCKNRWWYTTFPYIPQKASFR